MNCCIEDVETLSSNANCGIIIKKGTTLKTDKKFDQQKCVIISIHGNLHQHDNLSYEAYIGGDPDICYRIIYDGNKMSV